LTLTELQKSLLGLSALNNVLELSLCSPKKYIKDEEMLFVQANYVDNQVVSFIEEWTRLEGLAPQYPAQKEALIVVAPAVKRARKWTSLKHVCS
jgi:hypothetical protein